MGEVLGLGKNMFWGTTQVHLEDSMARELVVQQRNHTSVILDKRKKKKKKSQTCLSAFSIISKTPWGKCLVRHYNKEMFIPQ